MVIEANTATGAGGGIYTTVPGNRLTINGGSILGNFSGGNGGGIIGVARSTITLTNVTVSGNTAIDDGGGIIAFGSTCIYFFCPVDFFVAVHFYTTEKTGSPLRYA
jgi:predicted outer membrane repeat protein